MDELEALRAEVARCHARLEIDHCFVAGEDGSFVRRDIPMAERPGWPDAVFCAEVHAKSLEQDAAEDAAAYKALFDAAKALLLSVDTSGERPTVDPAALLALGQVVLAAAEGEGADDDDDAEEPADAPA